MADRDPSPGDGEPEDGFVGRMRDAYGHEITFFSVGGRVTIDGHHGMVLDFPQQAEFARLYASACGGNPLNDPPEMEVPPCPA